jgi:REP element-mobilizing transposase RayT
MEKYYILKICKYLHQILKQSVIMIVKIIIKEIYKYKEYQVQLQNN